MKVIYQEKDNPNSVGEFEILDRAQIEKLSKHTDDFLETSDKDFKFPENNNFNEDDERKKEKYRPLNKNYIGNYNYPHKGQMYHNHYNQNGIPTPYNMGYPPSKSPAYNSQGVVKLPSYNKQHPEYYYNYYKKLRYCTYRYTYLWLRNGRSFWCYPIYVTKTSISGWKWKNYKWKFFSIPIKRISNFYCYR